jgi:hypothetical protein
MGVQMLKPVLSAEEVLVESAAWIVPQSSQQPVWSSGLVD